MKEMEQAGANRRLGKGILLLFLGIAVMLTACNAAQAPSSTTGEAPSSAGQTQPSAGAGTGQTAAEKKEYVIGESIELSGPLAGASGTAYHQGLELFVKELNAKGGIDGIPVRLRVLDNESDPTKAVTTVQQLLQDESVLAIAGLSATPTTMPVIPVAQEGKIPIIVGGSSTGIAVPVKEWVFKTTFNQNMAIERYVDYFKEKGITKVAQIAVNNAFGADTAPIFEKMVKEAGLELVGYEMADPAALDVKPQLSKLRDSGAEAIVSWTVSPLAQIVSKNAAELNIQVPVIFSAAVAQQSFIDQTGEASEGNIIVAGAPTGAQTLPDDHPIKDEMLRVMEVYKNEYNSDFNYVSALGWDAGTLLTAAIGKLQQEGQEVTREGIRDALESVGPVQGFNARYQMSPADHVGVSKEDIMFFEVKNGQFTFHY